MWKYGELKLHRYPSAEGKKNKRRPNIPGNVRGGNEPARGKQAKQSSPTAGKFPVVFYDLAQGPQNG